MRLEGALERDRLAHDRLDRQRARPRRGIVAAQFLQHRRHLLDRMVDRLEHVALELRVVAVLFGVGVHQGQLGHQVLEVVHHEGRHAVERIELARHHQFIGGVLLRQVAGGLAARDLEQVEHFPVQRHRAARVLQHHEAEQLRVHDQGHHQPAAREFLQPGRQLEVAVFLGQGLVFAQVDHPLGGLQEAAELRIGRLDGAAGRLPAGHRAVGAGAAAVGLSIAALPQYPARTFDQGADRLDRALADIGAVLGQGARKAHPFLAVVIAVAVEMLADEDLEPGAEGAREQGPGQHQQCAAQEHDLHHAAPAAAEVAQVVAGEAHRHQVQRGAEQRGRMEHHAPRQRQRVGARGAALDRGADQRHGQGVDDAARSPGILVHLMEQHRLAVHVEIVGEHGADAETGELDGPALLHRLVAVHLLDQQHAQHRLAHAHRHVRQRAVEVEHQVGAQQRRHQQQAQVDQAADEYRGAQAERPAAARIPVVAQQQNQYDAPGAAAQDFELVGPD